MFPDMTQGHLWNTYMTKLKCCLYPWRQNIVFMMYIGFIFDQIWCISTKPGICIRNVRILRENPKSDIWGFWIFSHKDNLRNAYMTKLKWCLYPSTIYCLHDVYWVYIWPDMVHINKTQDMHQKCPYSRENPKHRYLGILAKVIYGTHKWLN